MEYESRWYSGEEYEELAGIVMTLGKTLGAKVAMVGLAAVLTGCSSVPDYMNPMTLFEDDTPVAEGVGAENTRAQADQVAAEAGSTPYPKLSSVPDRPAAVAPGLRDRVVEGLVADRTNARYTADAVKAEVEAVTEPTKAPILPAAGEPTSAVTAKTSVVKPASGPAMVVKAPAPPVIQEATASLPAAAISSVPLPPIPAAPGGAEITPASAPNGGEQAPAKPDGRLTAGGSVDPGKAALDAGETLQLATIQFGNNSTNLDGRDEDILRQVVAMQQQTGGTLRVIGHASSSGRSGQSAAQAQANMDVSMRRANAVAQALVSFGASPAFIQIEGQSDRAPLYDGSTQSGEAGNRRTEIYLVL